MSSRAFTGEALAPRMLPSSLELCSGQGPPLPGSRKDAWEYIIEQNQVLPYPPSDLTPECRSTHCQRPRPPENPASRLIHDSFPLGQTARELSPPLGTSSGAGLTMAHLAGGGLRSSQVKALDQAQKRDHAESLETRSALPWMGLPVPQSWGMWVGL